MAIEFHIYILVGALFFMLRGNRSWLLLLVVIVFSQHPVATLYGTAPLFTLWLYGFAAAFILANYSTRLSTATWTIFGIFSTGFLYVNLAPAKDPFAPMNYIWVALGFTALVALALRTRWTVSRPKLRKAVRFMADYSFSLYLIHYTVLYAASKFVPLEHLRFALPVVLAANVIAAVVACQPRCNIARSPVGSNRNFDHGPTQFRKLQRSTLLKFHSLPSA
jgi:peptidoglycan/LPS O-acetylase OafA/YrhL